MKSTYLFSHRYKRVGWGLLAMGVAFGALYLVYQEDIGLLDARVFALISEEALGKRLVMQMVDNNLLDELALGLLMVGGILTAFSKERIEDEYIAQIRLESLLWAVYVNYGVLLLAVVLVYGMAFVWVMIFNLFTLLLVFLVRYHWALYRMKKQCGNEELSEGRAG